MGDSEKLTYIQIQWDDIHHSRLQEWTLLATVMGIFLVIFGDKVLPLEKPSPEVLLVKLSLSIFGFLVALIGAMISWQHSKIFDEKMGVIKKLEEDLTFCGSISFNRQKTVFSANIL
jgi:hypothetical protein